MKLLLIALGIVNCAFSFEMPFVESQPVTERIDAFVRTEMERQRVPGVAIGVVKNGEVLKAQGYGLANVEHDVAVKADTIFQSGSLGKQFTAAAVMLLVEDGKLALSDPLTKFFPDGPESWRDITIYHLLTHTSGIPDYTHETFDLQRNYTEEELAKMAAGLSLEFPPGARWRYSNTGYVLLGIIIHKASGQFYWDILRDRVFLPSGMTTARIISEADIVRNRAAGYRLVNGELKNQEWVYPTLNTTADGALYFTVLDLIAWDKAVSAKEILKPESWEKTFAPAKLNSGKTFHYGFGWSVNEEFGQPTQQHGGSWQGFQTYYARYLDERLSIIVLCNLAEAEQERFVAGIAAIINPKMVEPDPTPIPDKEPEVTSRLRSLLIAVAEDRVKAEEFVHVPVGYFTHSEGIPRYRELLRKSGDVIRIDLTKRYELGDDRVHEYNVECANKKLRAKLALAPDGRIAQLQIRANAR